MAATALAIAIVLICTRSETIEQGLELASFRSGDFTYKAWSYGNWRETKRWGVTASTYAPPYTLVLAIQPDHSGVRSIEILSATVVGKDGAVRSVLEQLVSAVDEVELRPSSDIVGSYAVFTFESILTSNADTHLEIRYRVDQGIGANPVFQTLEIKGFERKSWGFTFLDAISGI